MKLVICRNVKISIRDMYYENEEEEIYEDVENIYMEGKKVRKYDKKGNLIWCNLILFNDKEHKGILNKNHVYVSDKDTMEIK